MLYFFRPNNENYNTTSSHTYLRLGLLSPPIRTSFDGLVAETIDDSASVTTALEASIDT